VFTYILTFHFKLLKGDQFEIGAVVVVIVW